MVELNKLCTTRCIVHRTLRDTLYTQNVAIHCGLSSEWKNRNLKTSDFWQQKKQNKFTQTQIK